LRIGEVSEMTIKIRSAFSPAVDPLPLPQARNAEESAAGIAIESDLKYPLTPEET